MKTILLTVLALLTTLLSHGQALKKLEVSVGASFFAPVSKDVAWDNRAWGQRVQFTLPTDSVFSFTLALGYQQDKDRYVQMPVLAGVRIRTYKNLHLGLGAGATFFKEDKARFTLTPSIGYQHKRWYIEQSLFRTTKFYNLPLDGEHFNNAGFSVFYRL